MSSIIKPPKVLKVFVNSFDPVEYWSEPGATIDGGANPYDGVPYRWSAILFVEPQAHGDPSTTPPFYYDGLSVHVGDWITTSTNGLALQIVSITSNDGSQVGVVLEDIERYNLLLEPFSASTYGTGQTGQGILFEVGDDGAPILGPIDVNYLSGAVLTDIEARFRYRNLLRSFVRVNQPDHGMAIGDVIRPDHDNPGKFTKALADNNVSSVIGVVTDVNTPGEDWFNFKPLGEIRENVKPDLVGAYGDFFYVDAINPGHLTNVRPNNNARPVFMRLDNANRALLLSTGSNQDTNETKRYNVPSPAGDQVNFTLPVDAETVLWMSINGIENSNYTFDLASKGLVFNPTATGYGVDVTDEVYFIYKS